MVKAYDLLQETLNPELKKARLAKEAALLQTQQVRQAQALSQIPQVEKAQSNQPRLSTGEVNPDYIPGSLLRGKTAAPEAQGVVETSTGGRVETLRKLPTADLQLQAEQQQTVSQAARAESIREAFQQAINSPLPSLFNPALLDVNAAALTKAAGVGAGVGAVGAGATLATGAIIGTAGAAAVPLAAGALVAGVAGVVTKEYLKQKGSSIAWASGHFDDGLNLQKELIKKAKAGADPNDIIREFMIIEQEMDNALRTLEYISLKDPSSFAADARRKINEASFLKTSGMIGLRQRALLDAMVNTPKVQETF
jgi:hypothetical protein